MVRVRWSAALGAAARAIQVAAITITAKVRLGLIRSRAWVVPALGLLAFLGYVSPKGWLWG